MSAFVIANTALKIIFAVFLRDVSSQHQCFRIKNLQDDELCELVRLWDLQVPNSKLAAVKLVVARDEGIDGKIPVEHIAEIGLSITYYRNHNDAGLVYLETKVQSDEQGLQNIFTLRDSNFLDGSFDDYASLEGGVPGLLIQSAWEEVTGQKERVPSLLKERVTQVITLLHPDVEPVPVRRFAAFAESVCSRWCTIDSAKDATMVDSLVGNCFDQLDMFPDPFWQKSGSEHRIKRRLELNSQYADLMSGGSELDPEDVIKLARAANFLDGAGNALDSTLNEKYIDLCVRYASAPSSILLREIPFPIFEQLFKKDSTGLKLGDRVRTEIENYAPSRLLELDASDVITGLNSKFQGDAERFLLLQSDESSKPLAELLSPRTRKAIEKLAAPSVSRFSNPIIQLARIVRQVQGQVEGLKAAKIHIELTPESNSSNACGLFAFIYGASLKALIDETQDVPGAWALSVSDKLLYQSPVPALATERDVDKEADQLDVVAWTGLSLAISVTDESGRLIESIDRLEWAPDNILYLAFFWLLVAAEESPIWEGIGELIISDSASSGDWINSITQREQPLSYAVFAETAVFQGAAPHVDSLLQSRHDLKRALCESGLSIESLNDFTDAWQVIIESIRRDFIPDGTRPKVLEAVLGSDILAFSEGEHRLMLPTQPLRLRWIASYLNRCLTLASSCMTGAASFSTDEGDQYLDWLESLSPHETPPTTMGSSGEILHARSEISWFEEFAPIARVAADVSVDQHALKSIGARIINYLDVHPFKRDGLSILLLLPPSDHTAAELLRIITKGHYSDLRVSLTVAAPKNRWERIARLAEALPSEERKAGRGRLFPARDLSFIDFDRGADVAAALDGYSFDISVVTHVLQESVVSQQNTDPVVAGRAGSYDPVLDRPSRLESAGGGGAMSVIMRPRSPDVALDTWGTLVVRANRSCPVSPTQPENVDFVELRINFQDSARVFNTLHQRSHWVITLERHISREQIESVEAGAPDILSVETDIGSNGLNTLIVSSHSGRELIEARLARKLWKLKPAGSAIGSTNEVLANLAGKVYEETRKLSPHLALQAMGVARVTEEILGLCIARRFADELYPALLTNGVLAWISLDEHASWFGGAANIRADMCRVIIRRPLSGCLDVDILVLEGKFRQNFDTHGLVQASRTKDFLTQVLASSLGGGAENVDAEMWRERLLSAIESVAADAVRIIEEGVAVEAAFSRTVPADIRQDFRQGNYRLRSVEALYSVCLWESTASDIEKEIKDGITVVRSSRAHIFDLIARRDRSVDVHGDGENLASSSDAPVSDVSDSNFGEEEQSSSEMIDANSIQVKSGLVTETLNWVESSQVEGVPCKRGMSLGSLKSMYDEILACFACHNVSVLAASPTDHPIIEGPASILFKVRAGAGVDPRKLFEKAQALKLTLELEQDQNISFGIDKGYVTMDVPKKSEDRYYVNAADLWGKWERPVGELAIPLGEDRHGELVAINFSSSNSPHLLVAGTTGSGKSEALNTMLYGLVKFYDSSELRLMLVDPKGTELLPFENSSHLIGGIGWEDQDALVLLKGAVEEMQMRYDKFRHKKCRSLAEFNLNSTSEDRLPWWVIVLDEYADLTHDAQSKKDIEQELKRLAQKARAAGIHVIIATQKPSAEVISTNLRSNLPSQLALRVKSATESRVVIDEAGAESLNGKGDALLKADGKVHRVQCARVETLEQQI